MQVVSSFFDLNTPRIRNGKLIAVLQAVEQSGCHNRALFGREAKNIF